jgi:hypothetical protein
MFTLLYCPAAALAAKAIWFIWEAALSVCCVEKDWAEYCEYGESVNAASSREVSIPTPEK